MFCYLLSAFPFHDLGKHFAFRMYLSPKCSLENKWKSDLMANMLLTIHFNVELKLQKHMKICCDFRHIFPQKLKHFFKASAFSSKKILKSHSHEVFEMD
jgi:hypothetical protein